MLFLWALIGLGLPTVSGWMLVQLLEGHSATLYKGERWVLGALLGTTVMTFLVFLAHELLGVPLNLMGFLLVQGLMLVTLYGLHRWLLPRGQEKVLAPLPAEKAWPRAARILLGILLGWTAIKLVAGTFMLVVGLPYLDDTVKNWNMRGKMFFETQELVLLFPGQNPGEAANVLSSYPPSVPLTKTWLATLANEWQEGLVNLPHLFWFALAAALVFFAIRREAALSWALLGTYALISLPLYLVHGTNAYADVFLSAHIFAALALLLWALRADSAEARAALLRVCAFAIAVLTFTKNEAVVLYLPALLLFFLIVTARLFLTHRISRRQAAASLLCLGLFLLVILGPWLIYKWMHGMTFGNAKPISGIPFAWQPGVVFAVVVNTFFEGNWLLLFPLLLVLFAAAWRRAFASPLLLFSAFFLLLYVGQLFLYMFTPLSTEATYQTGYARGLVHLVPVLVVLTVLLLQDTVKKAVRHET